MLVNPLKESFIKINELLKDILYGSKLDPRPPRTKYQTELSMNVPIQAPGKSKATRALKDLILVNYLDKMLALYSVITSCKMKSAIDRWLVIRSVLLSLVAYNEYDDFKCSFLTFKNQHK